MAKKKKNQGTQKIVKNVEASNVSPPYEVASNKSNTSETVSKNKPKRDENTDSNLCKCKDKPKSAKPKTWESITKLYGDADTTEVWNGKGKDTARSTQTKMKNKKKQILKEQPEHKTDDKNDTNNAKSKKPKKRKSVIKKSVINFYRKQNKHRRDLRSDDTKLDKNEPKNDSHVKEVNVEPPVIRFKVRGKPGHESKQQHNGTGDACINGPCRRDLENRQQKQKVNYGDDKNIKSSHKHRKLKVSTDKQVSEKDKKKEFSTPRSSSEKVKNLLSKCSFLNFFCKQLSNKPHDDNSSGEPMFEMKVDSVNMRVLNSAEINDNVKKFGHIEQNPSCICPSRKRTLQKGKHDVCAKGVCESALNNNRKHFDCKCKGKNNLIVCQDTNCNTKTYLKPNKKKKKCKLFKSSRSEDDRKKPKLKVVLDRTSMNILNSYEIGDMIKEASQYEICPTGICNVASKDPNVRLQCKCIGKKIVAKTTECTDKTCSRTVRNRKLSDICSRLFCKSDNMLEYDSKKVRGHKRRPIIINQKQRQRNNEKQQMKAKSDMINKRAAYIARQNKRQGGIDVGEWNETFCECSMKKAKPVIQKPKKEKTKKSKTKKRQKRCKSKCISSKKIIHRESSWKDYIMKCLKRKRKRCEKKIKEKEKEFRKKEKKTRKENLKIQRMLDKKNKIEEPHWNCITKFVSGILNLGVNLIKGIFTMAFSLLLNPIGSYVYVRERAKDPPGTVQKICDWFHRTWSNKTTKVSQTVKESDTMNVIADQIEDLAVYDTLFASKGTTKEEKLLYEKKKRLRKRRILKRHDEALYGCRHMLLTTMRKTPCLWFYYICPDLYPQCLSLVTFMRSFFHIIIYLLAFMCWTPCIVTFELCRAFLCCFLCTG